MKVLELLTQARNTLQDQDKIYWDDSELLDYYNECKKTMAAERLEIKTTATLTLDPLQNDYDTSGILRYIRAFDDENTERKLYQNDGSGDADIEGIVVKDYNKVYVTDPTIGSVITFQVVTMPPVDNLAAEVRIGDENAFKYFILSKAYEKESDMESFGKADFFYTKFLQLFRILVSASSSNYTASNAETSQSYFY